MYRLCRRHGCRTFSNLVTACWSRVSDLICAMWRCSYLEQARQSRPSMPSERKNLVSAVNIDVSATCPSGFSSNQQWKSGDVAIQDDRWPLVTPAKPRPEKPPAVRRQHGTPKPFWEQIHGEAEGVWCIIGETCQRISLVTLKNVKGLHSLSSHIPHLQYLLQQPCHAMPQLPEIARVLK